MLIKIQAIVAAAIVSLSAHQLAAQAATDAVTTCKHCERPTPFGQTQTVNVVIMVRDSFVKPTMDAVIRDERDAAGTSLIAIKRTSMSPAVVYRALSSLSESRANHRKQLSKRATTVLSSGSAFETVPDEDRAWVAKLITDLSNAPVTAVAGVGSFPAVNFTLDKKTLRGK